jgi:hypothetical protein
VYIDDGTTGDSGELGIDVGGHEHVEQDSYSFAHDAIVDSVAMTTGDVPEFDHPGTGPDPITVDTASGPVGVGPAAVDTNADGKPDTAVVHDAHGDTVMYTDADGDGQADIATEITPDGQVVIADHTGDHQWTEVRHGHLTSDGGYATDGTVNTPFVPPVDASGPPGQDGAADDQWSGAAPSGWATAFHGGFSEAGSAQGVVRIDATTGQWISQN